MKPKLTLTFDAGFGEKYSMCLDMEDETAEDIKEVRTPTPPELGGTFKDAVVQMKRREFRKDYLIKTCNRLGRALAERMEDAEGWNAASRIEPAKRSLAGN